MLVWDDSEKYLKIHAWDNLRKSEEWSKVVVWDSWKYLSKIYVQGISLR